MNQLRCLETYRCGPAHPTLDAMKRDTLDLAISIAWTVAALGVFVIVFFVL